MRAEIELLAPFGITFTEEMKRKYVGRSGREMLQGVVAEFALSVSVDELLNRKDEIYLELIKGQIAPFKATHELLATLRTAGFPTALASGASPRIIQAVLETFELQASFDVVVCAENVACGKPAPDIFLEAARQLNVDPRRCVVFEDSEVGVIAARAAGMRCVAIPYDSTPPLSSGFAHADLVIEGGMAEFDVRSVLAWLGSA